MLPTVDARPGFTPIKGVAIAIPTPVPITPPTLEIAGDNLDNVTKLPCACGDMGAFITPNGPPEPPPPDKLTDELPAEGEYVLFLDIPAPDSWLLYPWPLNHQSYPSLRSYSSLIPGIVRILGRGFQDICKWYDHE